jgi:uncharacterized protein YndB with AHSA1/START domain
MTPPDVTVSTTIRASADDVWAAVADPHRITEWSPESSAVRCILDGPLPVGATFSGSNRRGLYAWSTQCRVVESDPGRAFAFDVTFQGMADARWRYEISEVPAGVTVEEQWWDHRGIPLKVIGLIGTGVANRRTHNEAGMRATLAALKAGMEDGKQGPGVP